MRPRAQISRAGDVRADEQQIVEQAQTVSEKVGDQVAGNAR
jgi:hypothetical protein